MKKRLALLTIIYLVISLILLPYCWIVSLVLFILFVLGGFSCLAFLVLNKLYKHTNHWKNQFLFQKNFISNLGYREDISRNFEVANLGSNPALYGFFYEKVRGQNWATGSQGLPMDFEILKYFHSYIKEGGFVLIPIMPFTAISQYIKTKPDSLGLSYYTKFATILDYSQIETFPDNKKLTRYRKYPLIYNPKLVRHIIRDIPINRNLEISEQAMSAHELELDAIKWIKGWEKEFDTKNMKDFFSDRYKPYEKEGTEIIKQMIDFCIARNLNPVLITVPMSSYLSEKFSIEFRQRMLTDFISNVNVRKVKVLDYMFDERFSDASLYKDSFFLNLKGRKKYTDQVIRDLGLQ